MSNLNSLPTVITAPGDFITRDGRRVTIHEIGKGTFAAKGAVWKLRGGVSSPTGFDIWHVSGRHLPLNEDPRDIVGPWKVPSKAGDRRLIYSEGHRVRLRPETAGSWIDNLDGFRLVRIRRNHSRMVMRARFVIRFGRVASQLGVRSASAPPNEASTAA